MEIETINAIAANAIAENGSWLSELLIARGGSYSAGLEVFLVSLTILLALGFSLMFFLGQKNKRALEQTQELCANLRHDLQIAASCAIGMGQRIISLEQKINGSEAEVGSSLGSSETKLNSKAQRPTNANFSETFKAQNLNQRISAAKPKLQAVRVNDSEHQSQLDSFDKAGELLRSGMSEEEVAKRCELSSSETALMAMVMKQKSASA